MAAHVNGYSRVVAALCRAEGWPEPIAEHRFAPPRRWQLDLAWPGIYLAVEIQGGLFSEGRHVRPAALLDEMEKLNAAAVAGWTLILVTPSQVTDGTLTRWLARYFRRWFPSSVPEDALRLTLDAGGAFHVKPEAQP